MSVLSWVHSGVVIALGWTLLHFCWQSTVIALLYALADRCLAHATTAVRYGAAMAMLGLMPVAAVATFLEQERLVVHFEQGEQPFVASQVGSLQVVVAKEAPFAAPVISDSELWVASHSDRLMPWIDGAWLAGVCMLALQAMGGWWQLMLLRHNARVPAPQAVERSFAKAVAKVQLGSAVALRVSTEVFSPMAMGIWRMSVILPLSVATSLTAEQLEAVLAHELAHIRRRDYLWNLLQTAIECLFFFQPAVWWMSRRTRELREVCCDEIAAGSCAAPGIYAEALLQMEEQRAQRLQLAVALHGKGRSLLHRIRRVMGETTMEQRSMSGVKIAVAGLVVAGLVAAPHLAKELKAEPANVKIATDNEAPSRAEPASESAVALTPSAAPAPAPSAMPVPSPVATPAPLPSLAEAQDADRSGGGGQDFLERMKQAGYPLDLNKDFDAIISLRSLGVTPEYAKAMAQTGLGTPTLHELISLKSVGVTAEYVAGLKNTGAAPSSFKEVIDEKALGVTAEYAKAMAGIGMGTPTMRELINLKAMGITPEYVAQLKAAELVPADLHELISFRAVGVTPEYAKEMASTGFAGLSAHDLVSLKAQGVTPEYVRWIRTTFPNADLNEVKKAAVFHLDEEFIGKAKAHGFSSTDLDKLIRLKMTGLLN